MKLNEIISIYLIDIRIIVYLVHKRLKYTEYAIIMASHIL